MIIIVFNIMYMSQSTCTNSPISQEDFNKFYFEHVLCQTSEKSLPSDLE